MAASHPDLAAAADVVLRGHDDFDRAFKAITCRARSRFESRGWRAMQQDMVERLEVRERVISRTLEELAGLLGGTLRDRGSWPAVRAAFSARVARRWDAPLAETFFNSITRRVFATVGVDREIEFVHSDVDRATLEPSCHAVHPCRPGLEPVVRTLLRGCGFQVAWEDLEGDAERAAGAILQDLGGEVPATVEVLPAVFFRGKLAYVVGRMRLAAGFRPLVLVLAHGERGVLVDAVLTTEDEVSIVFSFTRSYFHVDLDRLQSAVLFLKSIMPRRRLAELYIPLGHNKHGKTELFRDIVNHLESSTEQFDVAPGARGMVMVVFTLPTFDVVFKVIRDHFDFPKTATRQHVVERYNLVFKHDRAGRLVDAQGFEHLTFPASRFTPRLLQELTQSAAGTVLVHDGLVSISHLYTERRLTPLDLLLRAATPAAARDAVLDYGQAIRDLAAANIFPGDLLLKNFGVTRHGNVVFYDYDELCLVTDCVFRDLPQGDDDAGGEPSFYVGPQDVFPEEFLGFLGLDPPLREALVATHGDLFQARFWRAMKQRHLAGEVPDIFPYRPARRLARPTASPRAGT
jgi:isocitrate dehydrogenase kinase/phosphatase